MKKKQYIKLGEKIYAKSLRHRGGFDLDIDQDIWEEIFEEIGRVAVEEVSRKPIEVINFIAKVYDPSDDRCPECGLPYSQCDPEGVGHYRG